MAEHSTPPRSEDLEWFWNVASIGVLAVVNGFSEWLLETFVKMTTHQRTSPPLHLRVQSRLMVAPRSRPTKAVSFADEGGGELEVVHLFQKSRRGKADKAKRLYCKVEI